MRAHMNSSKILRSRLNIVLLSVFCVVTKLEEMDNIVLLYTVIRTFLWSIDLDKRHQKINQATVTIVFFLCGLKLALKLSSLDHSELYLRPSPLPLPPINITFDLNQLPLLAFYRCRSYPHYHRCATFSST